jgi:hypothetical protein
MIKGRGLPAIYLSPLADPRAERKKHRSAWRSLAINYILNFFYLKTNPSSKFPSIQALIEQAATVPRVVIITVNE